MDLLVRYQDIESLTEILKNRLYFAVVSANSLPKITSETYFFNCDEDYVYLNYYRDFGPLNLSCVYKFCVSLNNICATYRSRRIVHYTSSTSETKTNAAFLIGCYAVIYLRIPPNEFARALLSSRVQFLSYVDASQCGSDWRLTLIDCYNAILKAHSFGFFNFADFNVNEYDEYDQLKNGDLNWLLPKKFLAFIGPTDYEVPYYHAPEFYLQYFIHHDVRAVIRLNNNTYNATVFRSVGIEHYDLFFPDGTCPPKQILVDFLSLSEQTRGAIAVHCKAGLGRTGSLIAAYIMKHYGMSAREAIAWLRICRPGSVIGQQQIWLESMEPWLWDQGRKHKIEKYGNEMHIHHHKYGIYSIQWMKEREQFIRLSKQKELERSSASSSARFNECLYPTTTKFVKRYLGPEHRKPNKHNQEKNETTQGDKLNSIKAQKQSTKLTSSSKIFSKMTSASSSKKQNRLYKS